MVIFKNLLAKSLFIALVTLFFIAEYVIRRKLGDQPLSADFLINLLLTCVTALGCVGLQELSRGGHKPLAGTLGPIMMILYLQHSAAVSANPHSAIALASVSLLAYLAALAEHHRGSVPTFGQN
nr:hypothetical protein [uncultured Duganella sp.]